MLTSNDMERKETLDKPFAYIRFVMDPLEGLATLDTRPKKPILFIEVVHGNATGVLTKQWIPLFLNLDIKTSDCFDIKAITEFVCKVAKKARYVPFLMPMPDERLGEKLTLCIPILSGECQLTFLPDGSVFVNRVPADLELSIETIGKIQTSADILCRKVYFSANNILNKHALIAETIKLRTDMNNGSRYSCQNFGNIAATQGDFSFIGKGFRHASGTLTAEQNIIINAHNIKLLTKTAALKNIELHHNGGVWVVKDVVQANGELAFYLTQGFSITEVRDVPGALKYILLPSATQPILFLANQTATGYIQVDTPAPIFIGNNENTVTFKSNQYIRLIGKQLNVHKGRLLSVAGLHLKAIDDIVLGIEKEPQVAILSHGPVEINANNITLNQIEMACSENFRISGSGVLVNVSSQIQVKGDAIWEMPTKHILLVHQDETSAKALTKPATVIIEGKLSVGNNALDIFASQASCSKFEGTPENIKNTSFTPFTTITVSQKVGERRIKHTFHSDDVHDIFAMVTRTVLGTPINASFSIGSDFKVSTPKLEVSGILSAMRIEVTGIQQGLIGQFDERVSLAPMVFKPFKGQVSLFNYFDPGLLYEISVSGETVFKSVLSLNNLTPELPRIVLNADGTLSKSPCNLRRVIPREQEKTLLTKVMLKEFGRCFLNNSANTSKSMMQCLETNALRYYEKKERTNEMLLLAEPCVFEPCIVDTIETLVFEDGHSEAVLLPTVFFPKDFNNRRLRDGAGCLFALEDISLSGVPGSALHVRGNLEAEEIVIQGLDTLSRTQNTWTRYETVSHENKRRGLFGKNETTVTIHQVGVTELQPGNEMVARRGARFINVNNIYFSGARDQLGSEGLRIENAGSFIDSAIVRNKVGNQLAVKQKGFLGLSGTSTSLMPVSQEVIGSKIQTEGPVSIQARYGQFDSTQFSGKAGEEPKLEFQISEFHFHELLRAIEIQNKSNEASLLSELKAQARTAKRKSRQSTTLLLVSLPVSYYIGGVISSYLQSVMGATATASVATAGLSGMGVSVVGATIQGQPLAKAALNGAVFSLIGSSVVNAPVLAESGQLTREATSGFIAGGTSAFLNHQNILEHALIGGAASGAAATVIPGSNLSATKSALKSMLRSGTAVVLSGGSANSLAVNLASAAMGAAVGEKMADLGSRHGVQLGLQQAADYGAQLSKPVHSVSIAKPERRSGLVGSDFQRGLNAAHQSANYLLCDAQRTHAFNYTTKGIGRTRIEESVFEADAHLFDTQPVILWQLPNRFHKTEESHVGTRMLGGLQALGGAAQIATGLVGGAITAPTGIGPLIATAVGTMGIDNVEAGLRTLLAGESQATRLFQLLDVLGKQTKLYGSAGAANIEVVLNLVSPVNVTRPMLLGYKAGVGIPQTGTSTLSELRSFAAERTFRSPVVLEYDPNKLYSGLPLDLFKFQKPWVKKDVLSETARLHPSPLLRHEETIVEQWTIERLRLLERWRVQDVSAVNEKMYDLLNKCHTQLRVRMTPDDLAAIIKEQRGIKIPKIEGGAFDHINNEWRQVQDSFKKSFNGPWSGTLEEAQILSTKFGDLSRLWDRFEKLIERAKCNPETTKLKN